MKAFRFPLERALAWRRTQMEIEESKLRQQTANLAELDRLRSQMKTEAMTAETDLRSQPSVSGQDLAALGNYSAYLRQQDDRIAQHRTNCERQLTEQQKVLLEARRRCRLLERLRERRFQQWQAAADQELEALAAESHLARLARK